MGKPIGKRVLTRELMKYAMLGGALPREHISAACLALLDRLPSNTDAYRRLALLSIGTARAIDDNEFARRLAAAVIREILPPALLAAAGVQKSKKHCTALMEAAARCANDGTHAAAEAALAAAAVATYATYAASAADAAAESINVLARVLESMNPPALEIMSV